MPLGVIELNVKYKTTEILKRKKGEILRERASWNSDTTNEKEIWLHKIKNCKCDTLQTYIAVIVRKHITKDYHSEYI